MMKEQANEYDIVIAAMEMRGMDAFTFLRIAKSVSDIPVVLTSYKINGLLVITTLQQGASQLCPSPLSREDARGLWQFVFRKGQEESDNDITKKRKQLPQSDSEQLIGNSKGKGKEKEFPTKDLSASDEATGHKQNRKKNQKRKRVEYGEENRYDDTNCESEAANKMNTRKPEKKRVKWNSDLHVKFMDALIKGNEKAIFVTTQEDSGTTDSALLAQNTKEDGNYPSVNIASPTSTSDILQIRGRLSSETSTDARYASNEVQRSGANPRLQSNYVVNSIFAARQSYLSVQNYCPEIRTTTNGGLSPPNFRIVDDADKGEQAKWGASFNPTSQPLGTTRLNLGNNVSQIGIMDEASSMNKTSVLYNTSSQLAFNETAPNQSILRGRIDQIRHAYWTNVNSGKKSYIPNKQAETVVYLHSSDKGNSSRSGNVSNGDVRSIGELFSSQDNVIQKYGYDGSSDMNSRFPTLTACSPHQNQFSFPSSENYVQSFMQSSCNIQVETTGLFQSSKFSNSDSHSCNLLPSYGLENQDRQPTTDLGGYEDLGVIDSTEEILNNTDGSRSQQPTDEDIFLETILAELRNDYAISDLESLGFATSNDVISKIG
ncbi:hypothetical protein SOVF_021750 [Spinacia oleracea]|nr:hypothetical protein SOVF_021750 [Spinacia oleracea]